MTNYIEYLNYTFADEEIYDLTQYRETSLDKASLGIDTMTAEIKSTSRLDTTGRLYEPIKIYRSGRLDGLYFLTDIVRTGKNKYQISGVSSVGRLQKVQHLGGIYSGETASSVINDIVGSIPVSIDAALGATPLYGFLPPTSDARDNLAAVLFAIGGSLTTAADGTLVIGYLPSSQSGSLAAGVIYSGARVNIDAQITDVTVYEHSYTPGNEDLILFDGTTSANQLIIFDEPAHDLVATGFSVVSSGANYAIVTAGTGTLEGKTYDHSTRMIHGSIIPNAPLKNEKIISAATLVSSHNVMQVTSRLMTYYSRNEHLIFDAICETEKSGSVLSVYHPFEGGQIVGTVETLTEKPSKVKKGTFKMLSGYVPQDTPESFDHEVILTGSGSYIIPNGVTRLSVTLIGGGSGGFMGKKGQDGTIPEIITTPGTRLNTDSSSLKPALGGDGGEGGDPGQIYTEIINVTPFSVHNYSCGSGGNGESELLPPSPGNPSTFDAMSSASGMTMNEPFVCLDGTVFGGRGERGMNGGNGGGWEYISGFYNLIAAQSIIVNGITYAAGADGSPTSTAEDDYPPAPAPTNHQCLYFGSLGGGAAYMNNGHDASATTTSGSVQSADIDVGAAGNGANAFAPDPENTYGKGGRGGNGGGGAGQVGDPLTINTHHPERCSITLPAAASGGKGSSGSRGGYGVIILRY